jgi:hypothetical protein
MWKSIDGYEGLYEVSNLGEVRRIGGEILKPQKESHGYSSISLSKHGIRINKKIHRLVAKAFVENPRNLNVTNHIDGNKKNNLSSNLEWTTSKENNQHSWSIGLNHNTEKQRESARQCIGYAREFRLATLAGNSK